MKFFKLFAVLGLLLSSQLEAHPVKSVVNEYKEARKVYDGGNDGYHGAVDHCKGNWAEPQKSECINLMSHLKGKVTALAGDMSFKILFTHYDLSDEYNSHGRAGCSKFGAEAAVKNAASWAAHSERGTKYLNEVTNQCTKYHKIVFPWK